MAEFAYNNTKNTSMGYTLFKLNYRYHRGIFYKKDVDPRSKSKAANKLIKELRNLITIYRENLQYAQKLQKQAHNKGTKPKSYALHKKIWLNSKYIKTKYNWKLKIKFFRSFQVLHLVNSQAYKHKLPKQ